MKKVETIVAESVLDLCNRLNEIPSGALVLLTAQAYEEVKKVGSVMDDTFKYGDTVSANVVKTFKIYSIHVVRTTQIKLVGNTAWTALIGFNLREFSGKVENNLYVIDFKQ